MYRVIFASDYRFGFNGKEMDNEVSGQGNQYDYGFRIYNPRIAKFLSVDPLSPKYPWYTPYQFAGNKPIFAIDLDGLEEFPANDNLHFNDENPQEQPTDHMIYTARQIEFTEKQLFMQWLRSPEGKEFSERNSAIPYTSNAYKDLRIARGNTTNIVLVNGFKGFVIATAVATGTSELMAAGYSFGFSLGVTIGTEAVESFTGIPIMLDPSDIMQKTTKELLEMADLKIIKAVTPDDIKYMDAMNTKASYMTDGTIMIRDGYDKDHIIMEEIIHNEQKYFYGDKFFSNPENTNFIELEAKELLLQIGKQKGWNKEVMDELKKESEHYWKETILNGG